LWRYKLNEVYDRWDDKKFENKYLKKLERNWARKEAKFLQRKNLEGRIMLEL